MGTVALAVLAVVGLLAFCSIWVVLRRRPVAEVRVLLTPDGSTLIHFADKHGDPSDDALMRAALLYLAKWYWLARSEPAAMAELLCLFVDDAIRLWPEADDLSFVNRMPSHVAVDEVVRRERALWTRTAVAEAFGVNLYAGRSWYVVTSLPPAWMPHGPPRVTISLIEAVNSRINKPNRDIFREALARFHSAYLRVARDRPSLSELFFVANTAVTTASLTGGAVARAAREV